MKSCSFNLFIILYRCIQFWHKFSTVQCILGSISPRNLGSLAWTKITQFRQNQFIITVRMTFHQPNKATHEVRWWGRRGHIVWFPRDFQSSPTTDSLVDTPAPEMQRRVTLTFLWMEKHLWWILLWLSWFSWIGFSANTEFSDLYDFYALKDCFKNSIVINLS